MSIINTIIINMRRKFKNADEAYNYFLNEIRNKRAKGEKVDTPYYIQVVKEELGNISNMFNFPR